MTCTNCQNRIEQELKNTAGILNLLVPGHFSGIKKDSDQTAQKVRYKDCSEKRTEKSTSSACLKYLSSVAVIFLPCFMRSCLRAYIAFIILTIFT